MMEVRSTEQQYEDRKEQRLNAGFIGKPDYGNRVFLAILVVLIGAFAVGFAAGALSTSVQCR